MTEYRQKKVLVTGCAGFIGSHLVETLLEQGAKVVGVDNFSTGSRLNVQFLERLDTKSNFQFLEGDIRDRSFMAKVMSEVSVVFHEAALGSVPRSIKEPLATNDANVDGFLVTLMAAVEARVQRFVFASSSSIYGDNTDTEKTEERIGNPLSPYAVSKRANELYAFSLAPHHLSTVIVGLRYFNVFGPRQSPEGAYAAVVPKWVAAAMNQEAATINGDGTISRDFCFIDNVVKANVLSSTAELAAGELHLFNVACGDSTDLVALHSLIGKAVAEQTHRAALPPIFGSPRAGDIQHSRANIDRARTHLGYSPSITVAEGIRRTVASFLQS